jgi:hypothetical protein
MQVAGQFRRAVETDEAAAHRRANNRPFNSGITGYGEADDFAAAELRKSGRLHFI